MFITRDSSDTIASELQGKRPKDRVSVFTTLMRPFSTASECPPGFLSRGHRLVFLH